MCIIILREKMGSIKHLDYLPQLVEGSLFFMNMQNTKLTDSRKTYYSKQKEGRRGKNRSFSLATNLPPSELETVVDVL